MTLNIYAVVDTAFSHILSSVTALLSSEKYSPIPVNIFKNISIIDTLFLMIYEYIQKFTSILINSGIRESNGTFDIYFIMTKEIFITVKMASNTRTGFIIFSFPDFI